MRKLYEIGEELERLYEAFIDADGEVRDDDTGRKMEAWFDRLMEERDEKLRRTCGLLSRLEAEAGIFKEESDRLQRAHRARVNAGERIKAMVLHFFEQHKIERLNLAPFIPRLQGNGGARPLVFPAAWNEEPAQSPEQFHQITISLDKVKMREALAAANAELCPVCGASVVAFQLLRREAESAAMTDVESVQVEVLEVACEGCGWSGRPDQTVRLGERGHHFRYK